MVCRKQSGTTGHRLCIGDGGYFYGKMYLGKAEPGDDCLEKTPNEYGYRRGIVDRIY
jgi:hypothetical protein